MHKISLAPVLSATLSRDSCWIICYLLVVSPVPSRASWNVWFASDRGQPRDTVRCSGAAGRPVLLGLLEDLDEAPALGRAQRPGLHDPHAVPDAGAVRLVVGLEPRGLAEHLAVQAVLDP